MTIHRRRTGALARRWRGAFVALLLLASTASSASAQNYSFDARRIALGGTGGTPNKASKLVEKERRYDSILIPIGLVKLLSNIRVFYPNRDDFDFVRAVEFVNSPFHQVFGRDGDNRAREFFRDLAHARLNPDLNAYHGSDIAPSTIEEGLLAMSWGKTFMLQKSDRSFQGICVGAGPYYASRAYAKLDTALADILSDSADHYLPDASLGIGGGETSQLALQITGGYRARFPMFANDGAGAGRNGMYVIANYHYLRGLRLDDLTSHVQLNTDTTGLVSPHPPEPPFTLDWNTSSKGHGMALDFGVAFVVNRWNFGGGVSGVANRIEWSELTRHRVAVVSLLDGSEFVHVKLPVTNATSRFELPVTYTGDAAYHREAWSVLTEFSHGFEGNTFRCGLEYRLGAVELRGAGRYSQGRWYPSAGAGFNLTRRFGVDVAVFGAQTFLERHPHVGLASPFVSTRGRTATLT